jgi:hypothetical protein
MRGSFLTLQILCHVYLMNCQFNQWNFPTFRQPQFQQTFYPQTYQPMMHQFFQPAGFDPFRTSQNKPEFNQQTSNTFQPQATFQPQTIIQPQKDLSQSLSAKKSSKRISASSKY